MGKITDTFIGRLRPSSKDQFFRDEGLQGFGVKVTPTGRISYFVEARIKGAGTRRKTLGQYPATPVSDAKRLAMEFLKLSQQGVDPVLAEKKQRAKSEALSVTVGDTFNTYLRMRSLKARTERDYRTTFRLIFQSWAGRPIRSISRRDAEAAFLEAQEERGMATAGKASRIMSAVFNFAMADEVDGERLIAENPFDVIKQKKLKRTPKPRDNYLNASEISRLITFFHNEIDWGSKQTKGVTPQGINYVMLLLSSGIRRSEGAGLRWEDVDWQSKVFVIRDTKNGSDHHIPMSSLSTWILEKQRKISGDSEWVFPSKSKSGHLEEPKSQITKIKSATGVHFTSHDLRRTFATHAAQSGATYEMIRQALNHKSGGGVTGQYIITQVETLRPVFEKVSDSYHTAFEPDWLEDKKASEAEEAYYLKHGVPIGYGEPIEYDEPF